MNSKPDENGLSSAHKLFSCPINTNIRSVRPQPKPSIIEIAIDPETHKRLPPLKPGDIVRVRTDKEKTWNKKESVIAPTDHPPSYSVLKKGNLIIRNCCHLIPTNEKFIVRHDYENIIEPSETTSWKTVVPPRTDIPSSIVVPSVRTKSGRITRKPKRNLEEC